MTRVGVDLDQTGVLGAVAAVRHLGEAEHQGGDAGDLHPTGRIGRCDVGHVEAFASCVTDEG